MVRPRIRIGEGFASQKRFCEAEPLTHHRTWEHRAALPARGEGASGASAPAAQRGTADYVSVKLKSPSFSIEVTTLSPGLSQTCLSLGWPAITPSGVPVKMMSPGFKVKYFEM